MITIKQFFSRKLSRKGMLTASLTLPGIALLSLGTTACDSDSDSSGASGGEFIEAGGLTLRMASREFEDAEYIEIEAASCG